MLLLPIYAACTFAATGCVESSTPLDAPPVTQDANVRWLLVNPANASIAPGDSLTFVATAEDQSGVTLSNVALVWTLTNSTVAKVDDHGVVTGLAPGTAVVQARAGSVTTLATVNIGAASSPDANVWVSISPASKDIIVGQSFQLASVVRDVNGNPVTGVPVSFTSSDASVALVSAGGVVTGKKSGEVVVTAVAGTSRATAVADVLASQVAKVSLAPKSMTLQPRQSGAFTANAVDSVGNPISIVSSVDWESSNPSVATVDDSGNVMALTPGSTSISATIGSVQSTGTVTVQPPSPASITLTPSSLDVTLGSAIKIIAVVRDSSGTTIPGASVAWSSGNQAVATVDSTGRVTGKSVGIASIRAQSGNATSFATVTVLTIPTGTVTVTPGSVTVNLGSTTRFSATVRDPSGQTLSGRAISWTTSQPFVATIDANGVATAVGPGSTVVTASSGGVNGSATLTVPGGNSQVDLSRQPANMTPLTDRPFDSQAKSLSDVADAEGWASSESKYLSTYSIVSDPTAPRSPSSVALLVYPVGMPRNPNLSYSPVTAWIPTPSGTHRMYVSIWL
ncbi:MAG TPA: Ig-like domain-containing protein, partial [Casimicrobiaceae bacterium]